MTAGEREALVNRQRARYCVGATCAIVRSALLLLLLLAPAASAQCARGEGGLCAYGCVCSSVCMCVCRRFSADQIYFALRERELSDTLVRVLYALQAYRRMCGCVYGNFAVQVIVFFMTLWEILLL